MNKDKKELLLNDLCARLPYHPIVYVDENLPRLKLGAATRVWEYIAVDNPCKPYLRPMSSMTEKEIKEYYQLQQDTIHVTLDEYNEGYEKTIDLPYFKSLVDFYNSHHLDYRGLIPIGLALEAPEGMYN